jgi:hypothetical protein
MEIIMSTLARAHVFADGSVEIAAPFHPGLVAALHSLPIGDRIWRAGTRTWWIAAPRGGEALASLGFVFPDAPIQDDRWSASPDVGPRAEVAA